MKKQVFKILFGAVLLMGIAGLVVSTHAANADTSTGWLDSGNLSIEKIQDLSATDAIPPTVAGLGNRDCTNKTLITVPAKPGQTQQSTMRCFVETAFGLAESNGTLQFNGTGIAGTVNSYPGFLPGIIPIPNSYDVMSFTSAGTNGLFLHTIRNLPEPFHTDIATSGQVTYTFTQPPQASLKDKAGNLLAAQTNSLSFSSNGKWMVVDSPTKAMLRVNVDTLEVLPFTSPFIYNTGIDPGAQTAVSGDGRYAVVYSRDFSVFKLFDLSTCPDSSQLPTTISGPVNCQSRDMLTFVKSQIPNLVGISHIRFTSNNTIEMYAGTNLNGTITRSRYSLLAPGQSTVKLEYLALGDSYASGEGAYNYKDGTDTANNKCHLSQLSYPYLIRNSLNLNSVASIACSGAKMKDVFSNNPEYDGNDAQATGKPDRTFDDEIYSNYLPGYREQMSFVEKVSPSVITISAFGNDIGFGDKVKRCLGADTCFDTYESRLEIVKEINSKFENLTEMYAKLKSSAPPSGKLYVVGYPQVGLVGGSCGANVHLTSQELDFARLLIDYLNDTVHRAADKAGLKYIDVSQSLVGHRLCETVYSNLAVNGLTSGDDFASVIGKESYHPNALGHRKLEETILDHTANLTTAMPEPNPSVTAVAINDSLPILQVPHAGGVANNTHYDEKLSSDTVFKQTLIETDVDGRSNGLKPGTAYSLSLHSETVELGSFTSDSVGNLNLKFTIPASIPVGFHTLHLQGITIAGEPVDLYKTIYVGASQEDIDGDGVPNAQDQCSGFNAAGQDTDLDKIDDACDPLISEPPASPTASFLSPVNGSTVSGTITLSAAASHASGIAGLQYKLDNQNLGSEQTVFPYSLSWDTKTVGNGQHVLSVVARSMNGQTQTASISVTVLNQAPQPSSNPLVKLVQKIITTVIKVITVIINLLKR